MRRPIALSLVALLLSVHGLTAQLQTTKETLTIGATSVGLLAATVTGMAHCEGVLETAAIRMWTDGSDPTSSVGLLVQPGSTIVLDGNQTAKFARFIRTTSTSATLSIQCVP